MLLRCVIKCQLHEWRIFTRSLVPTQSTDSRWVNAWRVYKAVGPDNMLFTIVGPMRVMLIADHAHVRADVWGWLDYQVRTKSVCLS